MIIPNLTVCSRIFYLSTFAHASRRNNNHVNPKYSASILPVTIKGFISFGMIIILYTSMLIILFE